MKPVQPTLTYAGIVIVAAGFGVIMFSWGKVAALTAVPLQLPYLLSGGLVGLGLILSGLTLVNINAKRQDAAARERQLGQVREVMAEAGRSHGRKLSRPTAGVKCGVSGDVSCNRPGGILREAEMTACPVRLHLRSRGLVNKFTIPGMAA